MLLKPAGELLERRVLKLTQKDKEHEQSRGERLSRNGVIAH